LLIAILLNIIFLGYLVDCPRLLLEAYRTGKY